MGGLFNLQKEMYTDRVRMRRLQALLALGTALSTVAVASQTRVASVNYTYRDTPLRGYRIGDEFLLPLESVPDLGWSAGSASAGTKIIAESKTLNLPTRQVDGKTCIPLRQAIEQLGGNSNWNPGGYDVLQVSSPIHEVTVKDGTINLHAALAVKSTISIVGSKKVMIDLEGAKFSRDTKIDADSSTSVVQYGPNTVRIVMNMEFVPNLPKNQILPGTKLKVDLNPEVIVPPKQDIPKVDKPPVTAVKQDDPPKQDDPVKIIPTGPLEIPLGLDWENETNTALAVRFQPGQWKGVATCRRPEKDVLEIVFSNMEGVLPKDFKLRSSAINDVSYEQVGTTTVLRFKLKRAMGADITSSANGVVVNLIRPAFTGGKLSGKVIVIDAGHGLQDHGSTSNGVYEKTVNLFLSRFVRDALTAEGVTVIMTRNDDSFPTLEGRPALANKNNADIFISIHANEPGRGSKNNPSGTIVFYHMGSSISKFLGECIQDELTKFNLLPSWGVRSDGTLHNSGLAVLRLSKMPGVLIETGFLTNAKDRQMVQSEAFGKALAKSVVAGLKTYYGQ